MGTVTYRVVAGLPTVINQKVHGIAELIKVQASIRIKVDVSHDLACVLLVKRPLTPQCLGVGCCGGGEKLGDDDGKRGYVHACLVGVLEVGIECF
jgi:hypothetical protein